MEKKGKTKEIKKNGAFIKNETRRNRRRKRTEAGVASGEGNVAKNGGVANAGGAKNGGVRNADFAKNGGVAVYLTFAGDVGGVQR